MILNQSQPCNLLAEKLRGEALAMLRENQVSMEVGSGKNSILCQVSSQTAPSAEAGQDGGHNDSSLLI